MRDSGHMRTNTEGRPTSKELWTVSKQTLTADKNLAMILGSVKQLPLRYWQPLFFFTGVPDTDLRELSAGRFPVTSQPGKTHPVISLKPLPDRVGYKVSPCSSKRPWRLKHPRYIRKGCRLAYTGHEMDKNSYVLENIEVPIPPSVAVKISFRGQVPVECIQSK